MKKNIVWIVVFVLVLFGVILLYEQQGTISNRLDSQKSAESGIYTSRTLNKKKVYLTFDDGPSKHTNQILDILKKNHVKATFFVVGHRTKNAKKKYQRIVSEGHTLGMHAYEHNYRKIYASVDAFSKDLTKLQRMLYKTTGIRPTIYRFPGGSSNACTSNIKPYIQYIEKKGFHYYDWNALSGDAIDYTQSPETLNQNILKDVGHETTSIILMHDLDETTNTVKALDALIKKLKKMGYEILPITNETREIHHVLS